MEWFSDFSVIKLLTGKFNELWNAILLQCRPQSEMANYYRNGSFVSIETSDVKQTKRKISRNKQHKSDCRLLIQSNPSQDFSPLFWMTAFVSSFPNWSIPTRIRLPESEYDSPDTLWYYLFRILLQFFDWVGEAMARNRNCLYSGGIDHYVTEKNVKADS